MPLSIIVCLMDPALTYAAANQPINNPTNQRLNIENHVSGHEATVWASVVDVAGL